MVDIGAVSGASRRNGFVPRHQPGLALGEFVLGTCLWPLRIAEAYKATSATRGAATIYVIHSDVAANPAVRDAIIAGTRAAAGLPDHKHLVKTLAAGLTGDVLWIATEEVEGSTVRELLAKKKSAGTAGLGARGTGNLIAGVAAALGDHRHGALASESVCVSRAGRVRVADLALAQGIAAAVVAGLVPATGAIAPEIAAGGPIDGPADVYGVGALLYEALVGAPLERGGPRPSEVVANLSSQIDEIVARSCHRDPQKRFGRADVLGEVVSEALGKGGAVQTGAVPKLSGELGLDSLVKEVTPETGPIPTVPAASVPSLAESLAGNGAASTGNAAVDRALATALADSTEKWLVAKGKLDYGPFSLAEIVRQIEKGDITHGNTIMDKDTGARAKVDDNPLLGPLVDAAKQKRDDARRAQAEVAQQGRETKKGVTLYAVIGLGVVVVVVAVIFVVKMVGKEEATTIAGVQENQHATLDVKVSLPKPPPPRPHGPGGGGGHHGGGGGFHNTGTENATLDMSGDDDDDSDTSSLDMGTVFRVYSGAGNKLGGCMASNGASSAHISIIIGGPTGRVNFVKVNGKASGGLQGCVGGVLSGLQFPTLKSGRTRAEFDINL